MCRHIGEWNQFYMMNEFVTPHFTEYGQHKANSVWRQQHLSRVSQPVLWLYIHIFPDSLIREDSLNTVEERRHIQQEGNRQQGER